VTGRATFTSDLPHCSAGAWVLGHIRDLNKKKFILETEDGLRIRCKYMAKGRFKLFDGRRVVVKARLAGGPRTLHMEVIGICKA